MRQVNICRGGECGGECYACRVKDLLAQRSQLFDHLRRLLERDLATARYGPFCDDWRGEDDIVLDSETADDYFNLIGAAGSPQGGAAC